MNRNNKILMLSLFFGILIVSGMIGIMLCQRNGRPQITKWTMKEVIHYDASVEQQIEQLLEDGIDVVFWQEHRADTVMNLDYNRSIEVKTMGVAGDASILFPNSNGLPVGETGYCILGEDTAWRLFGSTKIIGRSVEINGEAYQIAGIEYQVKELCVYELPPDKKQEIAYMAIRSEHWEEAEMDKRRLEMAMDVGIIKLPGNAASQ